MASTAVSTFVAAGDSFTEGLEDELRPDGRHRGWADRVAEALATANGGVRYANLAVRGRLLDQVADQQVPRVLELAPDLVSFHAGGNDALRPGVDIPGVVRRYDAAVERLVAPGRTVLLFTVLERAGGTGRSADNLARKFASFNEGIRATAERHGAVLVDVGPETALHDRRLWFEDRLHLNAQGHRRIAAAVLEALGVTDEELLGGAVGWWRRPLPPVAPLGRRADLAADVRWFRRYLLPWVGRRLRGVSSGDNLTAKQPEYQEVAAASGSPSA